MASSSLTEPLLNKDDTTDPSLTQNTEASSSTTPVVQVPIAAASSKKTLRKRLTELTFQHDAPIDPIVDVNPQAFFSSINATTTASSSSSSSTQQDAPRQPNVTSPPPLVHPPTFTHLSQHDEGPKKMIFFFANLILVNLLITFFSLCCLFVW